MCLNRYTLLRKQSNGEFGGVGCYFFLFTLCLLCILASILSLIFYDAALVELHMADHSNATTKNILVMAWVTSLKDFNANWLLEKEMEEYCGTYDPTKPRGYGYHGGREGGIHVHIFFRDENQAARHEIQAVLSQQGCSASFTQEESLFNFANGTDIAKTRSYERELVLQDNIHYDVVINMDLDNIISLPSLSSFENALAKTSNNPMMVVCANERKTWCMLTKQLLWEDVTFTEGEKPSKALIEKSDFCAEGFAMYSWNAWSSVHCNFDSVDESNGGQQLWLRSRVKHQDAHINFQKCLQSWHDELWIGVQPDLVIWRKLWWCPWITLLSLVLLGSIVLEHLSSVASDRGPWIQSFSSVYGTNSSNKSL